MVSNDSKMAGFLDLDEGGNGDDDDAKLDDSTTTTTEVEGGDDLDGGATDTNERKAILLGFDDGEGDGSRTDKQDDSGDVSDPRRAELEAKVDGIADDLGEITDDLEQIAEDREEDRKTSTSYRRSKVMGLAD